MSTADGKGCFTSQPWAEQAKVACRSLVIWRNSEAFYLHDKVLMAFSDTRTAIAPVCRQAEKVVAADIVCQFNFADTGVQEFFRVLQVFCFDDHNGFPSN